MKSEKVIGFKIQAVGRLSRSVRARKEVIHRGKTANTSMNIFIEFAKEAITLKYGKCGLKLWIARNIQRRQIQLKYGTFGIKAQENGYLKLAQLERIKADIVKKLKNKMNIFFNFYPVYGLTIKGATRMGSGKGDVSDWYVPVQRVLINGL
eukprot:gene362-457_t